MSDLLDKIRLRIENDKLEVDNPYNADFNYLDFHADRFNYLLKKIKNYYQANANFLDIGSLFAYLCLGAKIIGYNSFGVDLDKYVQKFSPRFKKWGIDNRAANLAVDKLPFSDDKFNLIVASEVLEHFDFHPLIFFQEIKRVLKPGGRVIITTPNLVRLNNVFKILAGRSINWDINEEYWDGVHRREFTAQELRQLANRAGLQEEKMEYYNFNYPNLPFLVKIINAGSAWIFPHRQGNLIITLRK